MVELDVEVLRDRRPTDRSLVGSLLHSVPKAVTAGVSLVTVMIAPPGTATAIASVSRNVSKLPLLPAAPKRKAEVGEFELEYINDTGAGRNIFSKRALREQGVPESVIGQCARNATQSVSFNTGGGYRQSDKSVGMTSGILGKVAEACVLDVLRARLV